MLVEEVGNEQSFAMQLVGRGSSMTCSVRRDGWKKKKLLCVSPCLGQLCLTKLLVVPHTDWLCTETAGKTCSVSLRGLILYPVLSLETPEDAE